MRRFIDGEIYLKCKEDLFCFYMGKLDIKGTVLAWHGEKWNIPITNVLLLEHWHLNDRMRLSTIIEQWNELVDYVVIFDAF